jgi:predicted RNase H-like HicB family nuclease
VSAGRQWGGVVACENLKDAHRLPWRDGFDPKGLQDSAQGLNQVQDEFLSGSRYRLPFGVPSASPTRRTGCFFRSFRRHAIEVMIEVHFLRLLDKSCKFNQDYEMKLTAAFKRVDDWWAAWVEEIPGVNTQGGTLEEARENLQDALRMVLEANRELSEKEQEATRREDLVVA